MRVPGWNSAKGVPSLPEEGRWPCQWDPDTLPPARLVAAFYLLLRDHVVPGAVEQVMLDVKDSTHVDRYTNMHLFSYAFALAGYLTEEP